MPLVQTNFAVTIFYCDVDVIVFIRLQKRCLFGLKFLVGRIGFLNDFIHSEKNINCNYQ